MPHYVPRKVFLTKGVGVHREKLVSFEMALRDARIAPFNLVPVSSILPPHCTVVDVEEGLSYLSPGEIVYCVLVRESTNQPGEVVFSAIGMAIPADPNQHGYLSEHHGLGHTEASARAHAEELASVMLTTALGIPAYAGIHPSGNDHSADTLIGIQRKSIAQSAVGNNDGDWTTVVAAAVFAD
jgi:arginine decarboxylase